MSRYKVVRKGQFAYGPVTSRNGDKISIALLEDYDKAIISQSYKVFEIVDDMQLLPEYLMMWFRRPEFDRYARFMSHGSTRETFDWDEMCEVELPVPSIERQQEIVNEYNTVANRIRLNEKLNLKLEETAQAIYKHWFVDFEFPVDLCQSEPIEDHTIDFTKGYKSSGGKMVYNEELDKEIPEGWNAVRLGDLCFMSQGIQVDTDLQFDSNITGQMNRFVRIIDYTPRTNEPPRYVDINDKKYFADETDIVMIRYGDAGTVCRRIEGIIANNLFKITTNKIISKNFLYYFLNDKDIQKLIKSSDLAVAMPAITHSTIKNLVLPLPSDSEKLITDFDTISQKIENEILLKIEGISSLKSLINLLLSKMTRVEEEKTESII
ncbi:restriction endonuclease subunit S [Luteirhabdus pelagi]|uniref:restriction endonuclease subunit S n=1 Tax=Luteirhabdus pelagi TaxID=2792783 RepID=UPI001939A437|nr:restriction endonuclease subunit S [Luteirhabdus pelagi]